MNTLSKPLIPPAKCSSSRRVLDSSCFPTGNWISGSWIRFGFSGRLDNKNFSFKLTTVLQGRIGLKTRFLSLGYWFQLVKLYYGFHEQLDLRIRSLSLGYWSNLVLSLDIGYILQKDKEKRKLTDTGFLWFIGY